MSTYRLLFSLAVLMCLCGTLLTAQTETGQITGTIFDPAGAVVPDAKITVKSLSTGSTREVNSTGAGAYTVTNLLPGTYQITATKQGFSTAQQQAGLAVGGRVRAFFFNDTATTETVVTVNEAAGLVNTETQTLAEVITTRQILDLPTLTRNPYDLVANAGNAVENDAGGTRGAGFNINGLRTSSTNILLDGAANNNEFFASIGQQVPLDSVQEFSVLTNNFTAEYGRASGGVVNVVTKSGNNDFHGTAYEFNRVSALSSNTFDNNANKIDKAIFVRNQFGYSIGGPIKRNKLFFFENTEWWRIRSVQTQTAYIPTPQLIAASAANTQAFFTSFGQLRPGLQTLGTLTKAQLAAAKITCPAGGPCAALPSSFPMYNKVAYNYFADSGGGDPENTYELVGRVDYNLSDKTQIYGRYAQFHRDAFPGTQTSSNSPYQGYDTGYKDLDYNYLLSVVHTFSPRFVSQSKAVFNRLTNLQPLGDRPLGPTLYYANAGTTQIQGVNTALPGYIPYNPGLGLPGGGPENFIQLYQDMTYVRGKHQFRFGGSYDYVRDNHVFGAYSTAVEALGTGANGTAIDNLLKGQLHIFQAAVYPQGKFPCASTASPTPDCTLTLPVGFPDFTRSNRYHEFAFYGQDAWKISPRVTLNLGLRWEYFGVQHNKHPELDSNYYLGTGSTLQQQFRTGTLQLTGNSPVGGFWGKNYTNFAPRVGFAWDIFGDGKTSLRGGYGIGYERNFGNVTFNVIQNPPNYAVVSLTEPGDITTIPVTTANAGPLAGSSGTKALPGVSLRPVAQDIKTAYAHFWSASIEREIQKDMLLALSYSGTKGVNLYSLANINLPGFGNEYLGDPCTPGTKIGDPGNCTARLRTTQYTTANMRANLGFSNYHSLNVKYTLQNIHMTGLSLGTNYTWSHAIDNGSSTFSDVSTTNPTINNGNFNTGVLDYFQPNLDRGNAEFDIRQRFSLNALYAIPYSRKGMAGRLLGGWSIDPIFTAHTGYPFSIFDTSYSVANNPRAFLLGSLPDGHLAPGTTPNNFNYLDMPANLVTHWVNPKYNRSDLGPFPGTMSGRNAFRGPGFWNVNVAVLKDIRFTERMSLQLRGEAYNLFNHANLYVEGANADTGSASYITACRAGGGCSNANSDRRNLQLAAKIIF